MWWRKPTDPFKSAFIGIGKHAPALFKVYIDLVHGWTHEWGVIVYSNGSSGTSSLYRSLLDFGARPVFHTHLLCPDNIETQRHYPKGVSWIYQKVFLEQQRPVRLISLVRSPVERLASAFFFSTFSRVRQPETHDVDDLIRRFVEYVEALGCQDWFEEELRPALDIDVYADPFDRDAGFRIFERENVQLLVLRLDLSDEDKSAIVSDFLELDGFELQRSGHVAANKAYDTMYQGFKSEAVLPAALLSQFLQSRYTRHFFSSDEIERFHALWTRGSVKTNY